jgi:hypothetical protein
MRLMEAAWLVCVAQVYGILTGIGAVFVRFEVLANQQEHAWPPGVFPMIANDLPASPLLHVRSAAVPQCGPPRSALSENTLLFLSVKNFVSGYCTFREHFGPLLSYCA